MEAQGLPVAIRDAMEASPHAAKDTARFAHIECESMTIRAPGCRGRIDLVATHQGPGIWLSQDGTDSPTIGIHALPGQTCIWIARNVSTPGGLTVVDDGNGHGVLQFRRRNGEMAHVSIDQLRTIADG